MVPAKRASTFAKVPVPMVEREDKDMTVTPVPQGYHTLAPYLVVKGAARAMDWYRATLDAEEVVRTTGPDGRIMHGEIRIGDSVVMICDEFPEWGTNWRSPESVGATTVGLWIYTEDCDS